MLRASMQTESGPVQVHLEPLCHLLDTEMTHCTTGNQESCGVGFPMCSRISNQCQENKVKHKLAHTQLDIWDVCVESFVSWPSFNFKISDILN